MATTDKPKCGVPAGGWLLVWADEFDRDGLPDPARWGCEEGFVRNEEAQFYTRARAENAGVVKSGHRTRQEWIE